VLPNANEGATTTLFASYLVEDSNVALIVPESTPYGPFSAIGVTGDGSKAE